LKALLVSLFAALDALPTAMDGDVGRRSLTTTQGHLPTSFGQSKCDHLVADGVLGGDAARCLECVPIKVAMLALEQTPCTALRLHAHAPLASLAAVL
jgi:hypothetical protein